jgi:hypothetical protein
MAQHSPGEGSPTLEQICARMNRGRIFDPAALIIAPSG